MFKYIELFLSFIQVGIFSVGGGYSAIPLIQNQVVEKNNWMTMTEFADIVTIAEMTPGPILINAATFVAIRIGGAPGAIIATLGSVLPSAIIVLTLAYLFKKYSDLIAVKGILNGLRPAIVALIASAGLSLFALATLGSKSLTASLSEINIFALVVFTIAFFILRKFKTSPIIIILGSGVIGVFFYL